MTPKHDVSNTVEAEVIVAKAKLTNDALIKHIESMSVMDLANLVKELEEKFGVSAQAMAAPVVAAGGGGGVEEEVKDSFDVVLTSFGEKKINVIKAVREVTNLGLKEAKELVDTLPSAVKEGATQEEADELKKKLEEAGAQVDLK